MTFRSGWTEDPPPALEGDTLAGPPPGLVDADADKTRTRTLAVTSDESRVEGHVWKLVIVERTKPMAGVDDWRFDRYELWRVDLMAVSDG